MYYTYICLYSIVNGNWGAWGAWDTCYTICDISYLLRRYRSCDSPSPTDGGSDCPGNEYEETLCSSPPCAGIYVIIECLPSSALISFTPLMNLNPADCEVYSIEHFVINYISELW